MESKKLQLVSLHSKSPRHTCVQDPEAFLDEGEKYPFLKLGLKGNPLFSRVVIEHQIYTELVRSKAEVNDEER